MTALSTTQKESDKECGSGCSPWLEWGWSEGGCGQDGGGGIASRPFG